MPIFRNNRSLLDGFRRGDRAALRTVYEYYVDEVATLARRGFTMESQGQVYVAGADAEGQHELVQDTFARAFGENARLSFDGLRPYRPFLLRITKNLMIDRYRLRKKGRPDGEGVGDIDAVLDGNADFAVEATCDEDLYWSQLRAVTKEFLAGLDSESQQIVHLRFFEELSQDAIGERLGCSRRRVRTVESKVQNALLAHLRKLGMLDS